MDLGVVSKAEKKKLNHMFKLGKYGKIFDRIRVVLFGIEGKTARDIANRLRRHSRWVQFWAARFREYGIAGLFDQAKSGAPSKLSKEEQQIFKERVKKGPLDHDKVSRFGGKELQTILKHEFNVEFSLSGIYALLHKNHLSWITPRPIHPKNDPKAMKAWLEENPNFISEIKKTHPKKTIEIWFFDEARFGQKGNLYRIWTETGSRTEKAKQMGFKYAYLMEAANPLSGEHLGLVFSTLDSDVMNIFLKELSEKIPQNNHVILVLDNAGYHTSGMLNIPENITLRHLPPYSPQLNPIEKIWEYLKGKFLAGRVFKDLDEIFEKGVFALNSLTNDLIMSICFLSWLTT